MRVVRVISLVARLALMTTLVLGLLFWLANLLRLGWLLAALASISIVNVHIVLGSTGSLFFLVLGVIALLTPGVRLMGIVGITYALVVPVLGVTQMRILPGDLHWLIQIVHLLIGIGAMYLILSIEKRYRHLKQSASGDAERGSITIQTVN
ncbi:hypothetical protein [Ktedonospora formicarum]|uniref:Uncharacterized protein n=1 Tax=Ktedonospora formicarum TaxID=2778364 RepID=A0A8J3I344_9CHLR|nr:hypothetical protein [Ktedonospora formicarum]GHO46711.1 hypothetical protein KSX_48740 [Ktedonospora formicarum]